MRPTFRSLLAIVGFWGIGLVLLLFPAFFQGIGYLLLVAGVIAALVNFRRGADQPC
jgi:hypothetical protein